MKEEKSEVEENRNEKNDSVLRNPDLIKALNQNRFHHFLFSTKKYKDILIEKEAIFSAALSIIFLVLVCLAHRSSPEDFFEVTSTLIPVFIGGMFTLLGLALAGLAIVTATIGEKFITVLVNEKKLYSIIEIVFSFYFAGAIIALNIVLLTIVQFMIHTMDFFNTVAFLIIAYAVIYLVIFSVVYSVMLLGTCIRILLVKYAIERKVEEDENN